VAILPGMITSANGGITDIATAIGLSGLPTTQKRRVGADHDHRQRPVTEPMSSWQETISKAAAKIQRVEGNPSTLPHGPPPRRRAPTSGTLTTW
jgi:hypothetical protein